MKFLEKFIIIILSACLLLTGCKKAGFLDITPDGRISLDDVFADQLKTESYLNTAYQYLPWGGVYYLYYAMLAAFTDDAWSSDAPSITWAPAYLWYQGSLTPSNNPFDAGSFPANDINRYDRNWSGIRTANTFLANIDRANVTDPDLKQRMKGEAWTLRAYYYFHLIRKYGGMPIISQPLPASYNFDTLERQSYEDCTNFIVQYCDSAIANPSLPWRNTTSADAGRFTKAVAYALKSEALLFAASPLWNSSNDMARWQEAAEASNEALKALTSQGYALYPNYEQYFYISPDYSASPNDKETIYAHMFYGAQYPFNMLMFRMQSCLNADKAGSCPSQELVDSYDMANGQEAILGYSDADQLQPIINPASGYDDADPYKNRDPRFYATVWYNNEYYGVLNGQDYYIESYIGGSAGISDIRQRTHTGYYLRKYRDPQVTTTSAGNESFREFRLAEIYLNYAEAENEAVGPTADVYNAVNKIRERAGMPDLPGGLSQDDMRERIHRERRVELPYEEKRFYDVRRWKILDKVDKVATGMAWTKNANGTFTNKRIVVGHKNSWADKYLIFPIPIGEISKMPAFTQNPGW